MSRSLVDIESTPPLTRIIIDRPDVLNAYNEELLVELEEGLEEVFADKKNKAVILTGRGRKSFTVGADINWLETLNGKKAREISRMGHRICNMIEQSSKVVIAAVNGYALGGGMELALACDLRIASTRARFGQPEVGLGIIPGFDGTQRLPELIGVSQAKEILFTGEIIDAQKASQIGLVNRLVTPRDLLRESKEMARMIAEQSSRAVGLVKDAINRGLKDNTDAGSQFETEAFGNCFDNGDSLKRIRKLKDIIHE